MTSIMQFHLSCADIDTLPMIEDIFEISDHIRYVAIYRDGHLEKDSKSDTIGASSSESDKYEELLVNPTLLKLGHSKRKY